LAIQKNSYPGFVFVRQKTGEENVVGVLVLSGKIRKKLVNKKGIRV